MAMSFLQARAVNDAVKNNPPTANGRTADIHITIQGSDFYYSVCTVMGFFGIVFLSCSLMKRRTERLFFYMTVTIQFTACVAYYAMGSNLGFTPISVEFHRNEDEVRGLMRQVFWVRYVDWFITTPLLLLDLLLTAGMPMPTILWVIFMDELMIIMGLVGAVTKSSYKWGFFAFGCAAMCVVFWNLLVQGRMYAKHLGSDVHRCYVLCVALLIIVWMCYPISWGVADGGNEIAPDSEAVFYGILDLMAKPIFSSLLLFFHRKIDPARLGLKFRDYDEDFMIAAYQHGENRGFNSQPEPKDETAVPGEGVRSSEAADGGAANGADIHHETAAERVYYNLRIPRPGFMNRGRRMSGQHTRGAV